MAVPPEAEHFPYGADIGVSGIGRTRAEAFTQAALALAQSVTDPALVAPREMIEIACAAPDDRLLLIDWLNRLIDEMAVRHMVFARFEVAIDEGRLSGRVWGEASDRLRHRPAVEPKGATCTALKVEQRPDGAWIAQCVVDL